MKSLTITLEERANEEYWQPELYCSKCDQLFMFGYTSTRRNPRFCPWCGAKFTHLRDIEGELHKL